MGYTWGFEVIYQVSTKMSLHFFLEVQILVNLPIENCEFRAIKKVPCNAPESVDLALHEFWALLALGYHENVVYFEDCYLQTEEKIVAMRNLKDDTKKDKSKVCQAYLNLLEASLKGECLDYTTQKRHVYRRNNSLLAVIEKVKKND